MLNHWLLDTETFAAPESLSTFQQSIPLEWIEQALESTQKFSVRRRKLPAELVVWLVVAMGLFRDRSITEVVTKLDLSWVKQEDSHDIWHGLRLYAVDGTQFRTADTDELDHHFGRIKYSATKTTEYPIVRLCALSSLRSRLVRDVAFGPSFQGEVTYAKQLSTRLTDNSLTLFDRCYLSAEC